MLKSLLKFWILFIISHQIICANKVDILIKLYLLHNIHVNYRLIEFHDYSVKIWKNNYDAYIDSKFYKKKI